MREFLQFLRYRFNYVLIFLVVLFLILAFVVYGLFNNQLFEMSSFSSLHNSSDVHTILEANLVVGETTLSDTEDFVEAEGIKSCSNSNVKLICFTAAPKKFVRTDNIVVDFLSYLLVIYSYRIEFEFQDAILVGFEVSKSATGF